MSKIVCTLRGTLSNVEKGETATGVGYLKGRLSYVRKSDGQARQVTAMIFGGLGRIGPDFLDGPTALFGRFDNGCFVAIGKAGPKPVDVPPAPEAARIGHHRTQRVGPGLSSRKVVWVAPVLLAA